MASFVPSVSTGGARNPPGPIIHLHNIMFFVFSLATVITIQIMLILILIVIHVDHRL